MLDKTVMKKLEDNAKEILEQKKIQYPEAEIEIVYIPTVITKIDGKIAIVSNNDMNLIK